MRGRAARILFCVALGVLLGSPIVFLLQAGLPVLADSPRADVGLVPQLPCGDSGPIETNGSQGVGKGGPSPFTLPTFALPNCTSGGERLSIILCALLLPGFLPEIFRPPILSR